MPVKQVPAKHTLPHTHRAGAVHQRHEPGLRGRKRQRIVSRVPAPRIARARLVAQIVPPEPGRGRNRWLERPRLKIEHSTCTRDPLDLYRSARAGERNNAIAQLGAGFGGKPAAPDGDERLGHSLGREGRAALGFAAYEGVHQNRHRSGRRLFPASQSIGHRAGRKSRAQHLADRSLDEIGRDVNTRFVHTGGKLARDILARERRPYRIACRSDRAQTRPQLVAKSGGPGFVGKPI